MDACVYVYIKKKPKQKLEFEKKNPNRCVRPTLAFVHIKKCQQHPVTVRIIFNESNIKQKIEKKKTTKKSKRTAL